jgi:nitrite reductase/ring-hydroxylating ferredoxin subunit
MEVKIASTKDIPPGEMVNIVNDGKNILVANVNGNYFALANVCVHMDCNISSGILDEDRVICPCHGSSFDVKTGEVLRGPAKNPQPVYKLKVEGDQILLIT